MSNVRKIALKDKYKKAGQIWIVTCIEAGIITLSSGNGNRPDIILYPSEIESQFVRITL